MHRLWLISAAALALAMSPPALSAGAEPQPEASPQPPQPPVERRYDGAAAGRLASAVLADLASRYPEVIIRTTDNFGEAFTEAVLYSRPRAADAGMCEADVLTLTLDPLRPDQPMEGQPIHARDPVVESAFTQVGPLDPWPVAEEIQRRAALEAKCAALPSAANFLRAPRFGVAARGLFLLQTIVSRMTSRGTPPFVIRCRWHSCTDPRQKVVELAKGPIAMINERRCSEIGGPFCTEILFGGWGGRWVVTITSEFAEPGYPPKISRVDIDLHPD